MNRVVTPANSQRKYGVGEARLLMDFVNWSAGFPSDSPLFEIRDGGVFLSETYKDVLWSARAAKGIDELFFWNPAWELEDGPSPLTTPLLPVPFTAQDLAAVLVGDIGFAFREQFGEIGQLNDARLSSFGAKEAAHARRALREAYELAAHALTIVGPLEIADVVSDMAEQRRADWRGAMVRALLEGSDTHQDVELVAAEQQVGDVASASKVLPVAVDDDENFTDTDGMVAWQRVLLECWPKMVDAHPKKPTPRLAILWLKKSGPREVIPDGQPNGSESMQWIGCDGIVRKVRLRTVQNMFSVWRREGKLPT